MTPPPDSPAGPPSLLDLRGRWRAWWSARTQPSESQTLTQRNIYIVPTRAGLAFCATLLLLLVASINYELSLGFALTFLLAGSAAASMHMTHNSLRGLTFHLKPLQPTFAGEAATLEMIVTNPGAARYGIGFGLDVGKRPIALSYAEVAPQEQSAIRLTWLAPGRGLHALPLVRAESALPVRAVPRVVDLASRRAAVGLSEAGDADAAVAGRRCDAGRGSRDAAAGRRHRVRRRARLPPRRHAAPGRVEEGGAHRRAGQPRDRRRRAARAVAPVEPGGARRPGGAAVATRRLGRRRRRPPAMPTA